eukprot:Pgem_evm1s5932
MNNYRISSNNNSDNDEDDDNGTHNNNNTENIIINRRCSKSDDSVIYNYYGSDIYHFANINEHYNNNVINLNINLVTSCNKDNKDG